jgi:hypothetical protein
VDLAGNARVIFAGDTMSQECRACTIKNEKPLKIETKPAPCTVGHAPPINRDDTVIK